MIRQLFITEGTNRRRDLRQLEDFYYHAIYDALREERNDETKIIALKRLKAKIVNLHSVNKKLLLIDAGEQYTTIEEEPTIYHLLKRWKRLKHLGWLPGPLTPTTQSKHRQQE